MQVKVRGRRVDLGEVEDGIMSSCTPLVTAVACTVSGGVLVAWCCPPQGYYGRRWATMARVLRACSSKILPPGLVPGRFLVVTVPKSRPSPKVHAFTTLGSPTGVVKFRQRVSLIWLLSAAVAGRSRGNAPRDRDRKAQS